MFFQCGTGVSLFNLFIAVPRCACHSPCFYLINVDSLSLCVLVRWSCRSSLSVWVSPFLFALESPPDAEYGTPHLYVHTHTHTRSRPSSSSCSSTTGSVTIPVFGSGTITANGATVWSKAAFTGADGVVNGTWKDNSVEFVLGPGASYAFTSA